MPFTEQLTLILSFFSDFSSLQQDWFHLRRKHQCRDIANCSPLLMLRRRLLLMLLLLRRRRWKQLDGRWQ